MLSNRRPGLVGGLAVAAVLLGAPLPAAQERVEIGGGWKFAPGDAAERARPDFDDSSWTAIGVDKVWEEQGYPKLDGYAWYRLRFALPGGLRRRAAIQDGLRLCVGKINNFDQTFLNGRIIGINGRDVPPATTLDDTFTTADPQLWNVQRCYVLPPDDARIAWDRENVLAVRVFDEGGQGGIWAGDHYARMVELVDYLTVDLSSRPFLFSGTTLTKPLAVSNTSSRRTLQGVMTVTATGKLTGTQVYRREVEIKLPPASTRELSLAIARQDQSALVRYEFSLTGGGRALHLQEETPYVLTPPAPVRPLITGPAVVGARPGRPFLFTIGATGARPMTFSAEQLPGGLSLDAAAGIITGTAPARGEYNVTVVARNATGESRRLLKIVVGDRIALTPPMGWNSWNAWGLSVDQDKVLHSARAFVDKGLRDHGWSYINIDDGWEIAGRSEQPKRTPGGDIIANEKFRDMKGLGDRLHALGLKFGIYSSPGPLTCGQYTGSYGHEENDARSYALWGIDYLKYDWCSYEQIATDQAIATLKAPYLLMRGALDRAGRDIVYSLCQYGMGKVWEWGDSVGGNLWRTTDDITDTWESMRDIGFSQIEDAPFAGPGRWNDPDMLVVGWVGWGPSLHPTKLTPDEQYTHISLWALLSAPLLIGADLDRLDDFTLNLLTNDEVLAVDQDPLGRPATPALKQGDIQVWTKQMADGSTVVGIFNLGGDSRPFALDLRAAGLPAAASLRDLWRQKDLGNVRGVHEVHVPSHGVVLLGVRAPR
jgi:hypothetical protein